MGTIKHTAIVPDDNKYKLTQAVHEAEETHLIGGEASQNIVRTASYVIAGATSSTRNKAEADATTDNTDYGEILQAGIDAVYATGRGIVFCAYDNYSLEIPITIKEGVALVFEHGSIVTPATSFDMFQFKNSTALENVCIDTSAITFTDKVLLFDGADQFGKTFWDTGPILRNIHLRGDLGAGTGTALYAWAEANEECVTFIRGDNITITGFEYGVYFKGTLASGECWITDNQFKNININGSVYHIYLERSGAAQPAIRCNRFEGKLQADTSTERFIECQDCFNYFIINPDSWGYAVGDYTYHFSSGARGNYLFNLGRIGSAGATPYTVLDENPYGDNTILFTGIEELGTIGSLSQRTLTFNKFICPAPGTDWTPQLEGIGLAASKAAKKAWIPLELSVGDKIISYNLVGDTTEAAALTLDGKLVRVNKANPLTTTDIAGGAITQITADGNFDSLATLTDPETVVTDKQYVIELLGTTGAGDSITVTGAEVRIWRKALP